MTTLFIYVFSTLIISFFCSLLESVILSVTHTYIAIKIKEGKKSGVILRDIKRNINHSLAAILTLNTVANTLGAAGVGAEAYHLYGSAFVALASGIFTILVLILSEILPKTLGAANWKRLAPLAAYTAKGLIILLYPAVKILQAISDLILSRKPTLRVTRDEIDITADIGEKEGAISKQEATIIRNLLIMEELKTEDILTPRSVIFAFQNEMNIDDAVKNNPNLRFSRIPVFGKDLDDIKGVVLKSDLYKAFCEGKTGQTVEALSKPLFAVPDSKSVISLLNEFIKRKEHIFLVIDEYGGTAGVVSLEDAVETLLGVEIMDESDSVADMRAFAVEKGKKRVKNWINE